MTVAEVDAADIPVTLRGQLLRRRPTYVAGAALMIGFQLALNRVDWLSKATIDGVFGPEPSSAMRPALLMFVLALVAFAARVGSRWLLFNAGRDGEYELRAVLLHRLHRLGAAFYRKMSAGEIMARASGDLENVRLLLGFGVMTSMFAVFAFVSALQVMIGVSGRLTVVAVLIIPVLVGSTRRLGRQLFVRAHAAGVMGGKLTEVVRSNLSGMRLVRTFGLERSEQARFEHANAAYRDAKLASSRAQGMIGPVAGAAGAAGLMAVFWYGASLLVRAPDDGGLTRGDFFAFWLAYGRLTMPIMAIGFSISIIQRGRASFSRLAQIFDEAPEVTDGPLPRPSVVLGGLDVRDLSFSYGDRRVVSGVSFSVAPGRSLAIVGRTGSGKSTVAMLLARLMPTPRGAVLLDGLDVCDLPLGAVRESVGYAQQEAFLFSSSVADNIALGLDDRTRPDSAARIVHAAREAHVHDEVQGLPQQFDTLVGERGVQLSGGQKQRVALARALVRGPKVLVLDDPLSAVDAKTEAAILDAIERQASARTVILVTHRVAAARRCDAIIVLDAGKIVDRGTHDELVARGGLYAAFASEQAAEGELDAMELDDLAPAPGGRS